MSRRSRRRYEPWRWSTLYPLVVLACACAVVLVGLAVLLRARRPVPATCREVLLAQIEEYARWAVAPERQGLEQRDSLAYAGALERFLLDYRELEAYDAWWRRTVAPTPDGRAGRTVPRPADLRDPRVLDQYLADEGPDGPCGTLPEEPDHLVQHDGRCYNGLRYEILHTEWERRYPTEFAAHLEHREMLSRCPPTSR